MEQEQNEEKKHLFLDQVRAVLRDEDLELSPPEYLAEFTELYERHFGEQTAFDPLKKHFNELMLKKEPEIRRRIEASEDGGHSDSGSAGGKLHRLYRSGRG